MTGWIGVDFDGTLSKYDRFEPFHFGPPIIPMVERVKRWLAEGKTVKIFTARVCDAKGYDREKAREAIEAWCESHVGRKLEVTNAKDFNMIELWDDKAVPVIKNTGMIPVEFLRTRRGQRVTHTRQTRRNSHA